ncbi:MAG: type II CAAX endopeptidase family protein [Kiloniellales bacterium]|nr:type II CAAX endopeptidase family protein [Kiloniellales bacterium]
MGSFLGESLRAHIGGNEVGQQLFLVGMLALHYLGLLAVIHIVVFRRRALSWQDLGLRPAAPEWYRRTLWVTLLTFALALVLMILVQRLVGRTFDNPQEAILAAEGLSPASFLGLLLVAAGLGPLVEELLFRGLLYAWLRRHLGVLISASISAALFASVHAIPWLMPSLFAIGVVLALLYERSGSLWPAIVVHGAYNAINLVLLALTIG